MKDSSKYNGGVRNYSVISKCHDADSRPAYGTCTHTGDIISSNK